MNEVGEVQSVLGMVSMVKPVMEPVSNPPQQPRHQQHNYIVAASRRVVKSLSVDPFLPYKYPIMHILAYALIVTGNLFDYLSSRYAARHNPRAREANGFVRAIGLVPMKIGSTVILCLLASQLGAVGAVHLSAAILVVLTLVSIHNVNVGQAR